VDDAHDQDDDQDHGEHEDHEHEDDHHHEHQEHDEVADEDGEEQVPELPFELTVGVVSMIHPEWWDANHDAVLAAELIAQGCRGAITTLNTPEPYLGLYNNPQ